MNKTAQDQIANHFYNAGVQLAISGRGMEKNAFSMRNAKQVAGGIAGAGAGVYGGGILGAIPKGAPYLDLIGKLEAAGLSSAQIAEKHPEIIAAMLPGVGIGSTLGLGLGAYGGQRAVKRLMR
jgi:hypothetical protein